MWKHTSGYMIRDTFLFFYKDFTALRNDTVFVMDSAMAVIEATQKKYSGKEDELHIRSIATGQTGIYNDKGPFDPKSARVEVLLEPPPPLELEAPQPPIPPVEEEINQN